MEFEKDSLIRSEESVEYKVRGGQREGAGRPSLGTTKKVSITLPDEIWEKIDEAKKEETMSAFLRALIINSNGGIF